MTLLKICFVLLAVLLGGCGAQTPEITTPAETPAVATQLPAPVVEVPTQTPDVGPLAARINGEGLPLADYQAELQRYLSAAEAAGQNINEEQAAEMVLGELIDQTLLAQAAYANGFSMDEADLDGRITQLAEQVGGTEALAAWQAQNGYTAEDFRLSLRREAAAAWQRDQIAAGVPEAVEQVHARQILLLEVELADTLHNRLNSGAEFATLARDYDPVTGGELGWFPRGYLLQPAIEEAAFALQPGEYSEVVETDLGYHLVEVIERDPQRPLSADARRQLQRQALADWLEEQRSSAQIEILTP
jgi:peptidyl-prolyl cis-trans isomerase C